MIFKSLKGNTISVEEHLIRRRFFERLNPHFNLSIHYEDLLELMYRPLIKPDQCIYDIGCHKGRHARPFLDLVGPNGKVIGFEPIPDMAADLRKLAGTHPNFEVFELALSNKNDKLDFVFAQGTPEESGLKQRAFNQPENAHPITLQVTVCRLDDVIAQKQLASPDFIKIDVEGAELDLLAGAGDVIAAARSIISIEFGAAGYAAYGKSPQDLWEFVQSTHYTIFDIFGYPINDIESWTAVCDYVSWDWFLVPNERSEELAALWDSHK